MCKVGGPRCPSSSGRQGKIARSARRLREVGSVDEVVQKFDHARTVETRLAAANRILDLSDKEAATPELDEYRTLLAQNNDAHESSMAQTELITALNEPDGGATWSPKTNTAPARGFCYSPYPERSKVLASAADLNISTLMDYFDQNKDLLDKDGHNLGLWNDPKDGRIYLDISVVTDDAATARRECLEADQIAFFDLQRFESAVVDAEAKSGQ